MIRFLRVAFVAAALPLAVGLGSCGSNATAQSGPGTGTETIVMVRHGEKLSTGMGQLDCMGLNRSLALPAVLLGRFGRADAIFAPNPGDRIDENGNHYSYVRALATIEPTAVQLGLAVNAEIGFGDIDQLQQTVTEPQYANSTLFIAWEHGNAYNFARNMLTTYGQDPNALPVWQSTDFETMYVFRITTATGQPAKLKFSIEQEGLTASLSNICPAPAEAAQAPSEGQ